MYQPLKGTIIINGSVDEMMPVFKLEGEEAVGYSGKLIDWVKHFCGWILEIVKLSDDVQGFKVPSHRWVVSILKTKNSLKLQIPS